MPSIMHWLTQNAVTVAVLVIGIGLMALLLLQSPVRPENEYRYLRGYGSISMGKTILLLIIAVALVTYLARFYFHWI